MILHVQFSLRRYLPASKLPLDGAKVLVHYFLSMHNYHITESIECLGINFYLYMNDSDPNTQIQ